MIIEIISLILAGFLPFVVLGALFMVVKRRVRSIIESPDEGKTPSEWAQFVDLTADRFITRCLSTVRAITLQQSGVETKLERRIEGQLAKAAISEKMPVLAAIAQATGMDKLMKKNPALSTAMIQWANKNGLLQQLGGTDQEGGPSNGEGTVPLEYQ